MAHRVKINVGGQRFETTFDTLTAYPDSFLYAMFHPRNSSMLKVDEDGYVFVDRDPVFFRHILNAYRTFKLPSVSLHEEELYRIELDYFQLPLALIQTNSASSHKEPEVDMPADVGHKQAVLLLMKASYSDECIWTMDYIFVQLKLHCDDKVKVDTTFTCNISSHLNTTARFFRHDEILSLENVFGRLAPYNRYKISEIRVETNGASQKLDSLDSAHRYIKSLLVL